MSTDVEMRVNDYEVTLSGTVESHAAERRAEDITGSVSGVTNVQHNLRGSRQDETLGTATGAGGASTDRAKSAAT